ncbi:hypothetical protein AB0M54_15200 [Actinoplanes sp. NPDC051470]|uniref:hypothetical protein n=1 Tax=Actinoplanes sp. NPDC051470 TaxID=3157224 RepID=UPI003448EC09
MAAFWLGAVVGGCAVAVASVWAGFFLYRRHLEAMAAAKIHLEAVRRTQYESDLRWRRQAAEWDSFAGQVLSSADGHRFGYLLTLIPTHSGLRRYEDQDQAEVRAHDGPAPSAT